MSESDPTVEMFRCNELNWISLSGGPVMAVDEAQRHNAVHEEQRKKFAALLGSVVGGFAFRMMYIVNHFRYGHDNNPFELEARAAQRTVPGIK